MPTLHYIPIRNKSKLKINNLKQDDYEIVVSFLLEKVIDEDPKELAVYFEVPI